jgi:hypothetical protein
LMRTPSTQAKRTDSSSCSVRTTQSRCVSTIRHNSCDQDACSLYRNLSFIYADLVTGPRSSLCQGRYAPNTLAPTHLHQRYHLPRSARQVRLESRTQCRERVRQSTEYAHEQHKKGAPTRRRELRAIQHPKTEGYQLRLPRQPGVRSRHIGKRDSIEQAHMV